MKFQNFLAYSLHSRSNKQHFIIFNCG